MYSSNRKKRGSGIIETAAGLILVIPVLFILIDVAALIVAQTANDQLAKQCARAAAEQPVGQGQGNANTAYADFANSGLVQKDPGGPVVTYGGVSPNDTVTATTTITVKLPVPVPLGGPATQKFVAFATEPVVGQMP
jgi:Flp pilus assembly protein TadG